MPQLFRISLDRRKMHIADTITEADAIEDALTIARWLKQNLLNKEGYSWDHYPKNPEDICISVALVVSIAPEHQSSGVALAQSLSILSGIGESTPFDSGQSLPLPA